MPAEFEWPEPRSAAHDKILEDVREHGCHVLNVAASIRP